MIKLGVVMDPVESVNTKKDSTYAMLREAQKRHWQIHYILQQDLFISDGVVYANYRELEFRDKQDPWYKLGPEKCTALHELNIVLMRKDPPFDMNYIYSTYLLELAEARGLMVANKPSSIRDANEKLFSTWFPQCMVPTLVSTNTSQLKSFIDKHEQAVLKPLDSMGGAGIFRAHKSDVNTNVMLETLTQDESRPIMAQRYIPEIKQGDKRILLIDGEPVPFALARIPAEGEFRGNLAAGGSAKSVELSKRDRWICEQVAPALKQKGLVFVGLDVIGDYLTEINVTSPTCIRELDKANGTNIAGQLLDCLEAKLS